LFRFDSEGRLKVDLLSYLHSVTSRFQVRNSVDYWDRKALLVPLVDTLQLKRQDSPHLAGRECQIDLASPTTLL
jgi:hypothetical protein